MGMYRLPQENHFKEAIKSYNNNNNKMEDKEQFAGAQLHVLALFLRPSICTSPKNPP